MNKIPYFSADGGLTWQETAGVTSREIVPDFWNPSITLAANTTETQVFYIYRPQVGFFRSWDGIHFERVKENGLPASKAAYTFLRAAPGRESLKGTGRCTDASMWAPAAGASTLESPPGSRLNRARLPV